MEADWSIVISVAVLVIAIIAYIIIRNKKDEKDLEKQIIDEENPVKEEDTDIESND